MPMPVNELATSPSDQRMPLPFRCPHCGHETLVEDRYSGHRGRCAACREPIELPAFVPARPGRIGRSRFFRGWLIGGMSAVLLCLFVFFAGRFVRWAYPAMRAQVESNRVQANLRQIAVALQEYSADYGTFPPAVTCDSAGKPLYSWRVSILPYLREESLHNRLRLDEAWDSENNLTLTIDNVPQVYRDSEDSGPTIHAPYVLITGKGTFFPDPLQQQIVSLGSIGDAPEETAVVAYVRGVDPIDNWAQPYDFDISSSAIVEHVAAGAKRMAKTRVRPIAIATANGRVVTLPSDTTDQELRALYSIDGGEPIGDVLIRD
jgi:hypothetical protein